MTSEPITEQVRELRNLYHEALQGYRNGTASIADVDAASKELWDFVELTASRLDSYIRQEKRRGAA